MSDAPFIYNKCSMIGLPGCEKNACQMRGTFRSRHAVEQTLTGFHFYPSFFFVWLIFESTVDEEELYDSPRCSIRNGRMVSA